MLNKEKLFLSPSSLGEGWRQIIPAYGNNGNVIGWMADLTHLKGYGEISNRDVSGETLHSLYTSITQDRTFASFDVWGVDKPFNDLYLMKKGGALNKFGNKSFYYFDAAVFTAEDVGKTIDIYVGTTPP